MENRDKNKGKDVDIDGRHRKSDVVKDDRGIPLHKNEKKNEQNKPLRDDEQNFLDHVVVSK